MLLVDNGDSIQGKPIGTMAQGEASIKLTNYMGYDIAIPGNHEFDYGMDRFLELDDMAEFPYISCNFNRKGGLLFGPFIIKGFDGVKIVFVGVTTPKTLTTSTPKHFQNADREFIYGFFQDETGERRCTTSCNGPWTPPGPQEHSMSSEWAHLGNKASEASYTYADVIANTTGITDTLGGVISDQNANPYG